MKNIVSLLGTSSILCLFFYNLPISAQNIIHVNVSAQGGNQNGQDWANAFVNITQALTNAQEGDQIWIAKGTYMPTETDDRNASFIIHSGLQIYGGFAGTENILAERSTVFNEVVLSGDIGVPYDATDNVYHVLYGKNLGSTTIIDGFTIIGGNAMDNDYSETKTSGGGIFLDVDNSGYAAPLINNCRFTRNNARDGGAIYCKANANPLISQCVFESNYADNSGGAIYKRGISALEHPFQVDSCTFKKNVARGGFGGGLHLEEPENVYWIKNSLFDRDSSRFGSGGGIFLYGYEQNGAAGMSINLTSCVFKENFAPQGGGLSCYEFRNTEFTQQLHVTSCVFQRNKTKNSGGAGIYFNSSATLNVNFSKTDFLENMVFSVGAAIWLLNANGDSCKVNVSDCRFMNNQSTGLVHGYGTVSYGNGYMKGYIEGNFTNCLFVNNEGGIAATTAPMCAASTTITNCTFFHNGQIPIEKTWYPEFDSITTYNNLYINNSIFWEDGPPAVLFYNNDHANLNFKGFYFSHSDLPFASCDGILGGENACGEGNVFQTYPLFVDTLNGDFRLQKCGPLVNKGFNIPVFSDYDLAGYSRIFGDTVDMGAYEIQETCVSGADDIRKANPTWSIENPVAKGNTILIQSETSIFKYELFSHNGILIANGQPIPKSEKLFLITVQTNAGIYVLKAFFENGSVGVKVVVVL